MTYNEYIMLAAELWNLYCVERHAAQNTGVQMFISCDILMVSIL